MYVYGVQANKTHFTCSITKLFLLPAKRAASHPRRWRLRLFQRRMARGRRPGHIPRPGRLPPQGPPTGDRATRHAHLRPGRAETQIHDTRHGRTVGRTVERRGRRARPAEWFTRQVARGEEPDAARHQEWFARQRDCSRRAF